MSTKLDTPTILWVLIAGGLTTFLLGIGMFGWELRFRAGAKKVTAMKVHDQTHHRNLLQIHDGKHLVEFPVHSEDNHRLGSVDVLYNPELSVARYAYESDARLLGGPFFGALGSLFLLAALVGLRNLESNVPAAEWTHVALAIAGVAALGSVGCWIVASSRTGWRWGFATLLYTLLMTCLASAGLAAIKHGSRL